MGLPIYQIEMYQKAPPQVKHIGITQKSPLWSWQLENIKSLQKKLSKSKKILKHLNKPCSIEKWVFQYTRLNVPKGPAPSETYRHHSKIPTLVLATGKHQKSAKKTNNN